MMKFAISFTKFYLKWVPMKHWDYTATRGNSCTQPAHRVCIPYACLLKAESPPVCLGCWCSLTVEHILIGYGDLVAARTVRCILCSTKENVLILALQVDSAVRLSKWSMTKMLILLIYRKDTELTELVIECEQFISTWCDTYQIVLAPRDHAP